jgi:hypothetical protein
MASENSCPPQLWTKKINTTNYLINRNPSQSNHGFILYHAYSRKLLKLDHLKSLVTLHMSILKNQRETKWN